VSAPTEKPQRGDVQTDEDGVRWIVLAPPEGGYARPSRVREGSLAAWVIFEQVPEKPLALRSPAFDAA
jgi:hypothetical protein